MSKPGFRDVIAESNSEAIRGPTEEGPASTEKTSQIYQLMFCSVLFCSGEIKLQPTTLSASTSNRPNEILTIDIPRQEDTDEAEEEQKTPTPTRMRSLTRLFSRVNPCCPRNVLID
ncbi:hypothetical protein FXO38_18586 [Capsicum annuum]|nr:hypothetical protein FXO38_18586 [Capsicum annuum]